MPATYVVLREQQIETDQPRTFDILKMSVEARSAEHACRLAAEAVDPPDLDREGVTLIAVPARNWTGGRHTLKAETQRRIRSA